MNLGAETRERPRGPWRLPCPLGSEQRSSGLSQVGPPTTQTTPEAAVVGHSGLLLCCVAGRTWTPPWSWSALGSAVSQQGHSHCRRDSRGIPSPTLSGLVCTSSHASQEPWTPRAQQGTGRVRGQGQSLQGRERAEQTTCTTPGRGHPLCPPAPIRAGSPGKNLPCVFPECEW